MFQMYGPQKIFKNLRDSSHDIIGRIITEYGVGPIADTRFMCSPNKDSVSALTQLWCTPTRLVHVWCTPNVHHSFIQNGTTPNVHNKLLTKIIRTLKLHQ